MLSVPPRPRLNVAQHGHAGASNVPHVVLCGFPFNIELGDRGWASYVNLQGCVFRFHFRIVALQQSRNYMSNTRWSIIASFIQMHLYKATTSQRGQCVILTQRTKSTCKMTTANMVAPLLARCCSRTQMQDDTDKRARSASCEVRLKNANVLSQSDCCMQAIC